MSQSFGARLRQQREERQIDLIAIAEQTKIKAALLEALERDDISNWPSGIFRRAYIRTYAQFIGLDPDAVLREFLETYPDPGDVFTALAAAEASDASRKDGGPPTRLRNIVDSAIGSLTRFRRAAAADDRQSIGARVDKPMAESRPQLQNTPAAPRALEPDEHQATFDDVVDAPASPGPVAFADTELPADRFQMDLTGEVVPQPAVIDSVDGDQECTDAIAGEHASEMIPATLAHEIQASNDETLETAAYLCTGLGRVTDLIEVQRLLAESARALNATGLIVWVWHDPAGELRPMLVHGYSEKVLVHLPAVRRDADNATAASFRSGQTCEIAPTTHTSGALVVPLLVAGECAGVLTVELEPGVPATRGTRALATLLAAALAQLVDRSRPAESVRPPERETLQAVSARPPLRPVKVRR